MMVLICLPFGISGAATTLIGNCVGDGMAHSARVMARAALLLEVVIASVYGVVTLLCRQDIPKVRFAVLASRIRIRNCRTTKVC
jgi:Na+-driven multidrug efflux pump